jgi:hypothetical protein
MNREEFIICTLLYRRTLVTGELAFEDRGDLILNTAHIGKVQEYYDLDKEYAYDESHGHTQGSSQNYTGERTTIRKRGTGL